MDVFVSNIFKETRWNEDLALRLFRHQFQHNPVYNEWCSALRVKTSEVTSARRIPFLPISFFKTHQVITGAFLPEKVFTSSGTTQTVSSEHYVKEAAWYQQSFMSAFELLYGDIKNLCIIGLLPSYLERQGSSLVYMVDELIRRSQHPQSGFYLYDTGKLKQTLQALEEAKQPTLLIGVTFALLDFAAAYPMPLHHTTIMETGGMKGRKEELTRQEVHHILQTAFGVVAVHSEYGMTELLSQAYSAGDGIYRCPPWMKIFVRDEDDPLLVTDSGKGLLNIIDLANKDSCAFIATDDVGIVHEDGSFEVMGRRDNSDLRGCSLLAV